MCKNIGKFVVFLCGLALLQVPLFFHEVRAHHHACHVQNGMTSMDRVWCALGTPLIPPNTFIQAAVASGNTLPLSTATILPLAHRLLERAMHLYAFVSWDWVILVYQELYWQNSPPSAVCMQLTGIQDQSYWEAQPDVCRARIFDQLNKVLLTVQLLMYFPILAYTLWWHMFLSQQKQLNDLVQTTDQLKLLLEALLRERQIVYLHDADTAPSFRSTRRMLRNSESRVPSDDT